MTQKRDYYEVLGVSRTATNEELRKAYKQAALKYHPDRNPGDATAEAKFKEATEAFSVLSDPDKRERYDRFGHDGIEGMGGFDFQNVDIFSHFQDLFADFFGGFGGAPRGRRSGPQRGADLRVQQRLTLAEAFQGCKKEIVVRAPAPCEACHGTGAAAGSGRETCTTCRGSGQVSSARGFVMFATTCPACRGEGSVIKQPCEACHGAGQVEKSRKVLVTFPAGIDAGQRLRVPGQGVPGMRNGPAGDLYVDVDLEPDDRFERDGLDLVTRANVSFADAALGTKLQLTMLDDSNIEIAIPPGTQPGEVITLKSKGMPRVDGRGRGALHVVVQVTVPKRVSRRAEGLLRELEKELQQSPVEKRASGG
jgi:molecular chaperone DnaJ